MTEKRGIAASRIVSFDNHTETISIWRVSKEAGDILVSEIAYSAARDKGFEVFALELGELILLDTGSARKLFAL